MRAHVRGSILANTRVSPFALQERRAIRLTTAVAATAGATAAAGGAAALAVVVAVGGVRGGVRHAGVVVIVNWAGQGLGVNAGQCEVVMGISIGLGGGYEGLDGASDARDCAVATARDEEGGAVGKGTRGEQIGVLRRCGFPDIDFREGWGERRRDDGKIGARVAVPAYLVEDEVQARVVAREGCGPGKLGSFGRHRVRRVAVWWRQAEERTGDGRGVSS